MENQAKQVEETATRGRRIHRAFFVKEWRVEAFVSRPTIVVDSEREARVKGAFTVVFVCPLSSPAKRKLRRSVKMRW